MIASQIAAADHIRSDQIILKPPACTRLPGGVDRCNPQKAYMTAARPYETNNASPGDGADRGAPRQGGGDAAAACRRVARGQRVPAAAARGHGAHHGGDQRAVPLPGGPASPAVECHAVCIMVGRRAAVGARGRSRLCSKASREAPMTRSLIALTRAGQGCPGLPCVLLAPGSDRAPSDLPTPHVCASRPRITPTPRPAAALPGSCRRRPRSSCTASGRRCRSSWRRRGSGSRQGWRRQRCVRGGTCEYNNASHARAGAPPHMHCTHTCAPTRPPTRYAKIRAGL